MSRKVIIFGATGTLGTHIAIDLQQKGYQVYAVGRRKSDNGFFGDYNILYYSLDIEEIEQFNQLPQSDISTVLHFAGALPATMEGYAPHKYIDSIIKGTLNVLEYTRKCGATKIIFPQSLFDISYLFGSKTPISPDAVRKAPITGDHAIYVIAKMAAVDLIEHYYHIYGIKRFILRLPRIYMFHPNPYTYTDGVRCLISDRYLIEQAIKGEAIEMWGDPERLLETICVKDFLQIIEKCIESPLDGGIYNAGSGGSTLKERIQGIIEVFSPKEHPSPIISRPEKRSSQQFVLDIHKTMEQLQYIPQYSWKEYLLDFKKDMETQPFKKLWGESKDYTK